MTNEDKPGQGSFGTFDTDGNPVPIIVAPRQLTEEEREIAGVADEVIRYLRENLASSSSISDFIVHYYALRLANKRSPISWKFFLGREVDPQKGMSSLLTDELRQRAELDSKVVEELKPRLETIPEGEGGQVLMTLKRIRDSHQIYTYGVLARFPLGVLAETTSGTPDKQDPQLPDFVYFAPTSACALHAADDLFKMNRKEPFYATHRSGSDAINKLLALDGGLAHYIVDRSSKETLKQDAGNYILVGLQGRYSNEPYTVPVSRFQAHI